jgi:hypothetical protein
VAPISCDKQEREKKTNQSRTVKSCIAARQARHGLPTSLMECTTVEWNFNQSRICQCPLAFHVLKASVVLFVRYCDQDEWRGVRSTASGQHVLVYSVIYTVTETRW